MAISTKTGDDGTTSLFGGKRVSKSCINIDALGDIDELNSAIGVTRSVLVETRSSASLQAKKIDKILQYIQNTCFVIGAQIASVDFQKEERKKKKEESSGDELISSIQISDTKKIETWVEKLEKKLPKLHHFILPAGNQIAADLFLSRAICRRAERSVVRLNKKELALALKFLNRLSDLLFLLARSVNSQREQIWQKFID